MNLSPSCYARRFVSTTNPRPTLGHSDWASMRLGGDVLDIYPGELHACTAPCDYYIGVRGFYGNASFVLLAGNHSGAPVRLSNGLPQLGFVQKGRMGRYTTHIVPGQEQLEIAVTPRYGDPDVYVVLGDRPLPTRQFWDYRSVSSWGQDIIAINTTSSAAYVHSWRCVAVWGGAFCSCAGVWPRHTIDTI